MVSNDDILFPVEKANLSLIRSTGTIATGPTEFDFIVPTGKRWRLRGATIKRDVSGNMKLYAVDPDDNSIILAHVDGTLLVYQPQLISIGTGWKIRTYFGAAASGYLQGKVLYDEENEY